MSTHKYYTQTAHQWDYVLLPVNTFRTYRSLSSLQRARSGVRKTPTETSCML